MIEDTPQLANKGQLYTSNETVIATPMNRVEYNVYRGWVLPSNEHPNDAGYLVEHIDGGESNHPNHLGYITWIPKDVFERFYSLHQVVEQKEPTWLDRLKEEYESLNNNIIKLHEFMISDQFLNSDISFHQRNLMQLQIGNMTNLLYILGERIHRATLD